MSFKDRLIQFMQGRYGSDALNRFLLILFWILTILYFFIKSSLLNLFSVTIAVWVMFRMLSRNYQARSAENQKFLKLTAPVRTFFRNLRNPSSYRIYSCPNCGQKLRVPKGKGRIQITCPKCHGDFFKRS